MVAFYSDHPLLLKCILLISLIKLQDLEVMKWNSEATVVV